MGVDPWSRWSGPYIVFLLIEENYLAMYFLPARRLGKQKIKDKLIDLDTLSYIIKKERGTNNTNTVAFLCSIMHFIA